MPATRRTTVPGATELGAERAEATKTAGHALTFVGIIKVNGIQTDYRQCIGNHVHDEVSTSLKYTKSGEGYERSPDSKERNFLG